VERTQGKIVAQEIEHRELRAGARGTCLGLRRLNRPWRKVQTVNLEALRRKPDSVSARSTAHLEGAPWCNHALFNELDEVGVWFTGVPRHLSVSVVSVPITRCHSRRYIPRLHGLKQQAT